MKLLLISALALGLAAVAPAAWAQGENHHQGGAPHAAPGGGMPSHAASPRMTGPSPMHAAPTTHTSVRPSSSTRTHSTTHRVVNRTVNHTTTTHRHVVASIRHVSEAHRTAALRRSHANIAKFRRTMVATRHFHAGPYRAPPGFHYRRWALGERLPGEFFARSFWLADFGIYGLFAPPYGYVWVRYGPDAVLIDQYTGEVISVDYGVFID